MEIDGDGLRSSRFLTRLMTWVSLSSPRRTQTIASSLTMSSARGGDSKCTIQSFFGARVSPVSAAEGVPRDHKDPIAQVAGESDEDDKNEEERLNEMVGAEAPNPITNEELLRTPATYARSCCDGRGVLRGVLRKEGED